MADEIRLFAEVGRVPVINGQAHWFNDIASLTIVRAELWRDGEYRGMLNLDNPPLSRGDTLSLKDVGGAEPT